ADAAGSRFRPRGLRPSLLPGFYWRAWNPMLPRDGRTAAPFAADPLFRRWVLVVGWGRVEAGVLAGSALAVGRPAGGAGARSGAWGRGPGGRAHGRPHRRIRRDTGARLDHRDRHPSHHGHPARERVLERDSRPRLAG